jgi:hypothetical protein
MLTFKVTAFALGTVVIYDVPQTHGFAITAHGIVTEHVKNGPNFHLCQLLSTSSEMTVMFHLRKTTPILGEANGMTK